MVDPANRVAALPASSAESDLHRGPAAMGTAFGVDALRRQTQPLDRAAADQVLFNDLRHVADLHEAVPDGFRIDDDRHAVLALVETAGLIDADFSLETAIFNLGLQKLPDLRRLLLRATSARMSRLAGVRANKDVSLKGRHIAIFRILAFRPFPRIVSPSPPVQKLITNPLAADGRLCYNANPSDAAETST